MDIEKLWRSAKAFAASQGLGDEAEDFAQEIVLYAYEKGTDVLRLDWRLADYKSFNRADKRILSSPQGQLSGFRTTSLDAPVDRSNDDSATLNDFIADQKNERRDLDEIEFYDELIGEIFGLVTGAEARKWARETYMKYIEENL